MEPVQLEVPRLGAEPEMEGRPWVSAHNVRELMEADGSQISSCTHKGFWESCPSASPVSSSQTYYRTCLAFLGFVISRLPTGRSVGSGILEARSVKLVGSI